MFAARKMLKQYSYSQISLGEVHNKINKNFEKVK